MALGVAIMVIGILVLMWISVKPKRKVIRESILQLRPRPIIYYVSKVESSSALDKFNDDLSILFEEVVDKYCFANELIDFVGVGVQHHCYEFESYPHGFVCGTIEREPNNPKDKKAVRLADIKGRTIGYIPKKRIKSIRNALGKEFHPRPFYGKVVWNNEETRAIVEGFTYGKLHDEKNGIMKSLAEYITVFPLKSFPPIH